MLVDVVRMRSEGVRLTPTEWAATPAIRGELRIHTGPTEVIRASTEPRPIVRMASLLAPDGKGLLQPLINAWVREMHGDQFLVVGEEFVARHYAHPFDPQAWWCTVVRE